ncbi:hypothetical protein Tco_0736581, partial [Tanacetum coccineum]
KWKACQVTAVYNALNVVPGETDGESFSMGASVPTRLSNTQTILHAHYCCDPIPVAAATNTVAIHDRKKGTRKVQWSKNFYIRWQQKMFFYLTTLGLARFLEKKLCISGQISKGKGKDKKKNDKKGKGKSEYLALKAGIRALCDKNVELDKSSLLPCYYLCKTVLPKGRNRTLKEMVTAMLISSGMSQDMWGEAILTATYLLNKIHRKEKGTEIFMNYGMEENIISNYLRVWGCLDKVVVPTPQGPQKIRPNMWIVYSLDM